MNNLFTAMSANEMEFVARRFDIHRLRPFARVRRQVRKTVQTLRSCHGTAPCHSVHQLSDGERTVGNNEANRGKAEESTCGVVYAQSIKFAFQYQKNGPFTDFG